MRLRTRLVQLSLGTVVPPILLAIVLGVLLIQYEQDAFRRGALDRNRAFMTAVDAEIRGHVAVLRVLGASTRLEVDDLAGFRNAAMRVLGAQPNWRLIVLALPTGEQLVNTNVPPGAPLPVSLYIKSLEEAVRTRSPVVGDVTVGRAPGNYGVPVRIPIIRDDKVVYVLSAIIELTGFAHLITEQRLPASWTSGLVDASGHFIARIPYRPPTDMASPHYLEAIAQSDEGWYRGRTVEGTDTVTAYLRSGLSRWTVGLAIPASEFNAAAIRAAWLAGFGVLLTVVVALSFAYWMGRRISEPIAVLAAAARSVGRNREPAKVTTDTEIEEVRDVAHALIEASIGIKERQQLVEREQKILRAADRAKDEFLAMLGHELRNPLSAVSNAASLLHRQDLSAEQKAAIQGIIMRQTEQLTRLVNDLLDVGRVVAGKIHLEQQPLDLRDVTQAALSAIRATGRADGHRVSVDAPMPVFVQGDRTRLEQVVANLVINAITYTPADGSVDIAVAAEGDFAVLTVVDTGAGLREEDRDAIFALFYQADKTLHRKGGLGIGLTLVQRLVEMHGGTVSAMSPGLGQGSTFIVRLPLLAMHSLAAPEPTVKVAAPSADILVVDDSEDVRTSLRLRLESDGHIVYLAEDGPAGLSAALSIKPGIALIDVGMPGMDGYELARQIRRYFTGDILLIALTGYGQPDDVRRAMEAGFDAHMVKPADFATLDELMRHYGRRTGADRGAPIPPR